MPNDDEAQAARVAGSLVGVATEAWSQSRLLIDSARNNGFGILALDVAAVIGLGSVAGTRAWPPHWWWTSVGFILSAAASIIPPPGRRTPTDSLPDLSGLFAQALAKLPDEAEAMTQVANRVMALATGNLGTAERRRGFNTVALGMLAGSAIATVLLFLHDFH